MMVSQITQSVAILALAGSAIGVLLSRHELVSNRTKYIVSVIGAYTILFLIDYFNRGVMDPFLIIAHLYWFPLPLLTAALASVAFTLVLKKPISWRDILSDTISSFFLIIGGFIVLTFVVTLI